MNKFTSLFSEEKDIIGLFWYHIRYLLFIET